MAETIRPKWPVTRLRCSKCDHEFGMMLAAKPGIETGVVCPKCRIVGSCKKMEQAESEEKDG